MKIKELLEKWNIQGLKIKTPILEMDWCPDNADKDAAWDLYVELLTRVTTQPLANNYGVEKAALNSVFSLFQVTRDTLKKHGRASIEFTRISVIMLNQIIRPFTAKWHLKISENNSLPNELRFEFREDLRILQIKLVAYTQLLSELAEVEDLTGMDEY